MLAIRFGKLPLSHFFPFLQNILTRRIIVDFYHIIEYGDRFKQYQIVLKLRMMVSNYCHDVHFSYYCFYYSPGFLSFLRPNVMTNVKIKVTYIFAEVSGMKRIEVFMLSMHYLARFLHFRKKTCVGIDRGHV